MPQQTDTTEKGLESLITNYLEKENEFVVREFDKYNRTDCVDEDMLFKFLKDTQSEEFDKLQAIHGSSFREKIIYRLNNRIKAEGIIEVLRKGITDTNVKLKLFYDKPVSDDNEKDQEQYSKNIFSVTRQVHYSLKNENSLDIVIFINGLPAITFELKNELTKQDVKDAIKQYKTSRDPREELFRLGRCIVHFAVDTDQVWMCTHLKADKSYFLPFNKVYNHGAGNPPNPSGIKTDYLWKEILTKDCITKIIQNYVLLFDDGKEIILQDGNVKIEKEKKLIFPRYHQLNVVTKLLEDVRNKGTGRKYLIQHSAGSGKSHSISWLAHQLVGLHDLSNSDIIFDSVIVVTDRKVLDKQIRENVQQFAQVSGVVQAITEGSKQLKEALEEGKKIIITTIQKFPYIVNEIGELPGSRFAIIIDEAHSSQSGNTAGKLNKTLSKEFKKIKVDGETIFVDDENKEELTSEDLVIDIVKGRKMLDNASYFAFTATPKNKTLELFGEKYIENGKEKSRAFDLYSMKQAIEEGFILDVLENYTTYGSYYSVLKTIKDDPQYDKKKAEKKIKKYIEGHKYAIRKKTELIIDHFMESVIQKKKIKGFAKAMIVTGSRRNAVKYKKAFDKYLKETGNNYKAIVAFSGEIDKQTESSLNGFSSASIPDEFKKFKNRFLIVANKFQTGFDEPLLHTMYVDKILGGVNAVQTLSRLNRTASGKSDTFVLDFVNTTNDIKESFDPYYETTILSESTDPNKLFDLQSELDKFQVYSKEQIEEYAAKVVKIVSVDQLHKILDIAAEVFRNNLSPERQEEFRSKCKSYVRLYVFLAQIVDFVNPYLEKLYIFLNNLQNKIRNPGGEDFSKGILENIDMESYRLQKIEEVKINLKQGKEIYPQTLDTGGRVIDAGEKDYLSRIVKEFNEKFGANFTDKDKVRKMTDELMQDVVNDENAIENISTSLASKDEQNARITFEEVLKEKLTNHIDSNFEVFKEYNDNEEFRRLFAGMMFEMMMGRIKKSL